MVRELLASDHLLSEELMKYKFHSDSAVRELVICLDIMMTSRKFAMLSHSASFMMPFYQLNNHTRVGFAKRSGLSKNLRDIIEDFELPQISLQETVIDILKDITENLLFNILNNSSEEYCEFLIEKLLDQNISADAFFQILDQSPIEDGDKSQLARVFEIARGKFQNYDIKQILKVMCTTESLRDSTDDIDKLDAVQSIQSISNYTTQLFSTLKNELHKSTDKILLKSISGYRTQTLNLEWRGLLEVKASNIPTLIDLERNQHTAIIFIDITNISKNNLVNNLSDAHLLRINFSLKKPPNNKTILEEAESRDPESYKLIVLASAKQIILARSKGLENLVTETKDAIPDLIYRLKVVAQTPEEKKLISDLTNGVLTAEKLETESSRSLLSLFTDSGKYTWIREAFSWNRLEPLVSKLEDLDSYLDNFRRLRSDLFKLFYSPEIIKKCILMNIPPSQLFELYSERREEYNFLTDTKLEVIYSSGVTFKMLSELYHHNKTKLDLLINPIAIEGYKNKHWSFKELYELNLDDLSNLLKPESIICIKSGFSLDDILGSFKNHDLDLHSENMQCLLKIGATKNIVELLNTYKPWMLKSLLKQSKEASENNKSFSDIYFHQGQGFMNPRTTPLPIVAGAGALLYRADSPGINLARIINRAVSRVDLDQPSSSPKPRRARSTPDLQRNDQTEPQAHTI